jgi:hypothetical protein
MRWRTRASAFLDDFEKKSPARVTFRLCAGLRICGVYPGEGWGYAAVKAVLKLQK